MARTLTICLMLLLPGLAGAEEKRPDKNRRPDVFQGMTSQLLLELEKMANLTDDQKEKIVALKQEFEGRNQQALRKMREDVKKVSLAMEAARKVKDPSAMKEASEQAKELRQAAERLRLEFESKLLEILSAEQRMKYEELKKMQLRPGKRPAP